VATLEMDRAMESLVLSTFIRVGPRLESIQIRCVECREGGGVGGEGGDGLALEPSIHTYDCYPDLNDNTPSFLWRDIGNRALTLHAAICHARDGSH